MTSGGSVDEGTQKTSVEESGLQIQWMQGFWKDSITLQGTNISHLGKRKIIFKSAFLGGYVSSQEGSFHFNMLFVLRAPP